MGSLVAFFADGIKQVFRGDRLYWAWLVGLVAVIANGAYYYGQQLQQGLIVTGLSDQVSWGVYIANFTYLVGVAAAAVMLVIPAYIFDREDIKHVVLIGEGVAVAAVTMTILFVTVDLGRPDRIWHMLPLLGRFNFPQSMLAWDVLVLTGYLFLNLTIPFYMLFVKYRGGEPNFAVYFPGVLISIFWAISIHTVTAFLFSSNVARPFWNTAILGPRFLASAFTSGPALIVLALQVIDRFTAFKVHRPVIDFMALIITVSLQINLFLLGVEFFTEFYFPTEKGIASHYLFFGVNGFNALVPWIWTAFGFNVVAAFILTIHPLRARRALLNVACALAIVGVWIEKGMGLIIPGFVPTPIGEMFNYSPSQVEVFVSLGIWAAGLLVFTILTKIALPIELGTLVWVPGGTRSRYPGGPHGAASPGHPQRPQPQQPAAPEGERP
ncbi:MAG: polysulfide reductase NrfD [Candidatus Lambdaproteobacteria bacterium]|nr:polysulfide reductase NrfD [Candidatus Lambdaproteobacteria bacterium]